MNVINVRNVNSAFSEGMWQLKVMGRVEQTRNGEALAFQVPVTTVYRMPEERVLFDWRRDANPFFHLAEALWMLAGSDLVDFVGQFASQMFEYSDDGETIHGAYGYRWRHRFGVDQLWNAIKLLRNDRTTRRCVIGIYDPRVDAMYTGKDLPCNTMVHFRVQPGNYLDMTVSNRSNDMVWGAYGANAVHFSVLQEFIARAAGLRVGAYCQVSNNLHLYKHHYHFATSPPAYEFELYNRPECRFIPLLQVSEKPEAFIEDCEQLVIEGAEYNPFQTYFFKRVVEPMLIAHVAHKAGDEKGALDNIERMDQCDWKVAADNWLRRRYYAEEAEHQWNRWLLRSQ